MSAWLVLLSSLFLMQVEAGATEREPQGCLAEAARQADLDLHRRYLYETNGAQGIRQYGAPETNESIVLEAPERGDEHRLIILWHGFMASPPEMRPLGEHLRDTLGANVYIPLLPGFGSGHRVADEFKLDHWRRSVEEAIDRGGRCHRDLALVGYSIGGGLLAEYLLSGSRKTPDRIRSVVLLSPYVETARWMAPGLRSRLRAGFLHLLRSVVRLRRLHLRTIHRVSRRRYRDLEILLADPAVYDQRFSLRAGVNMLHLTRRLRRLPKTSSSPLPVFLALSEADQTVNSRFSAEFVSNHFTELEDVVRYEREAMIAHQIVVPDVNPRAGELFSEVAAFLARHFESSP